MITIGGTNIVKAYLGSTELANIAIGDELLLSEPAPLPYDAEVEYLEGGTTQYIDTGVTPYLNLRAIISASGVASNSGAIFGSRVALNNSMYVLLAPSDSSLRFDYANKTNNVSGYLTERHTYGIIGDLKRGAIDSVQVCSLSGTAINNSHTIHIFGFNNAGTHSYRKSNMKIYSFSLWNKGEKFMELHPVRIGRIGYMYDKISGQLFGNSGTGDFVLGNDIT